MNFCPITEARHAFSCLSQLLAFPTLFTQICLCLSSLVAIGQTLPSDVHTAQIKTSQIGTSSTSGNPASNMLPDVSVPLSAITFVPPHSLSMQEKFSFATKNALGVPSFLFTAVGAASNQAQGLYPEFHGGLDGYGRYFWHSFADQAVDSYIVSFVMADAMHIDPRYQPLRSGSTLLRTRHAAASLIIAQTDSGQRRLNTPQLLGSGIAASLSTLYYSERDRTASLVVQRWGSNLAGDGLIMVLREFTPELSRLGQSLCDGLSFCSNLHRSGRREDPWQQAEH